jgi:poly [ADP-ribose] polymerase 2/3/4
MLLFYVFIFKMNKRSRQINILNTTFDKMEAMKYKELRPREITSGSKLDKYIGWYSSEKIDGWQGIWDGNSVMYTRSYGKRFTIPQWWLDLLQQSGVPAMSGEIKQVGSYTSQASLTSSQGGDWGKKADPKVFFHVFDIVDPTLRKKVFKDRLNIIKDSIRIACNNVKKCPIKVAKQVPITSGSQVFKMWKDVIKKKGEGLVLTSPNSKYGSKTKSSTRIKLKGRNDDEGKVIGYNLGGKIGTMKSLIINYKGVKFNLGIGFKKTDRNNYAQLFPIGTLIKFSYRILSKNGKPGEARFVGIRDLATVSSMTGEGTSLNYAYLIKISVSDNNNKFYEMKQINSKTFAAIWGRIGANGHQKIYPIDDWNKIYNAKIKKGYKDQTNYKQIDDSYLSSDTNASIKAKSSLSQDLVDRLIDYARQTVHKYYKVPNNKVKNNVSKLQIKDAQDTIDYLNTFILLQNIKQFNQNLKKIFSIIPRKMKSVKDNIIQETNWTKTVENKMITIVRFEQDLLDALKGQLNTFKATSLSGLNLNIKPVNDKNVIKMIKDMMNKKHSNVKDGPKMFHQAFEVINSKTAPAYKNYTLGSSKLTPSLWNRVANNPTIDFHDNTALLWHGSRNENWWSILQTGLYLRPQNVVTTGSMFGHGLYFADSFGKSLGYTSHSGSYYAKGKSDTAFLALFEVRLGKTFTTRVWLPIYNYLNKKSMLDYFSADSLSALKGFSLKNNEYIVYDQAQCNIKYLVEIK